MSETSTDTAAQDQQLSKAVQTLGLSSPEELASYETAFSAARDHLSQLIENSGSVAEKTKHEGELNRLDTALNTVREHLKREEKLAGKKVLTPKEQRKRQVILYSVVTCAVLLIGGWLGSGKIKEFYAQWQKEEEIRKEVNRGYDFIDKRKWVEASGVFEGVLTRYPEEEVAKEKVKTGLLAIENGKREEIGQQVTFLLSSADQAIEDGDLKSAQQNLEQALAQDPGNEKAELIRGKIVKARASDKSLQLVASCDKAAKDSDWQTLGDKLSELEKVKPTHPDIPRFRQMAKQGLLVMEENARRAKEIYEKALAADTGEYSEEALALAEESVSLSPTEESRALLKRLSAYTRILNVPEDYKTIAKAMEAAKAKDRILLAKGTYSESISLKAGVELFGEELSKTIIEYPATVSSVINVLDTQQDDFARISQLTIRHSGMCYEDERSPIVLVEGGRLRVDDCVILKSGGHGIAVIEGGRLTANRLVVQKCGWDGISVYGKDSFAKLSEVRAERNFNHGVDIWNGGRVEATNCQFDDNYLVGLLVASSNTDHVVKSCSAEGNQEVGFLFDSGSSVLAEKNSARLNTYAGIMIRGQNTSASLVSNQADKNGGLGIVVSADSTLLKYEGNTSSNHSVKNEWMMAQLEHSNSGKAAVSVISTVPSFRPDEIASPEAAEDTEDDKQADEGQSSAPAQN